MSLCVVAIVCQYNDEGQVRKVTIFYDDVRGNHIVTPWQAAHQGSATCLDLATFTKLNVSNPALMTHVYKELARLDWKPNNDFSTLERRVVVQQRGSNWIARWLADLRAHITQ